MDWYNYPADLLKDGIIPVYNQMAFWWDFFLLGILLSEIVGYGSKKTHIGGEKSDFLGKFIGWLMAFSVVGYFYNAGQDKLLLKIGPYALILAAVFIGLILWKQFSSWFGKENKKYAVMLALLVALIISAFALNILSTDEYSGYFKYLGILFLIIVWAIILLLLFLLLKGLIELFGLFGGGGEGVDGSSLPLGGLGFFRRLFRRKRTKSERAEEDLEEKREGTEKTARKTKTSLKSAERDFRKISEEINNLDELNKEVREFINSLNEWLKESDNNLSTIYVEVEKQGGLSQELSNYITNCDGRTQSLKEPAKSRLDLLKRMLSNVNACCKRIANEEAKDFTNQVNNFNKEISDFSSYLTSTVNDVILSITDEGKRKELREIFNALLIETKSTRDSQQDLEVHNNRVKKLQEELRLASFQREEELIDRLNNEINTCLDELSKSLKNITQNRKKNKINKAIEESKKKIKNLSEKAESFRGLLEDVFLIVDAVDRKTTELFETMNSAEKIIEKLSGNVKDLNKWADKILQESVSSERKKSQSAAKLKEIKL